MLSKPSISELTVEDPAEAFEGRGISRRWTRQTHDRARQDKGEEGDRGEVGSSRGSRLAGEMEEGLEDCRSAYSILILPLLAFLFRTQHPSDGYPLL